MSLSRSCSCSSPLARVGEWAAEAHLHGRGGPGGGDPLSEAGRRAIEILPES
jgi:hypothetical protein